MNIRLVTVCTVLVACSVLALPSCSDKSEPSNTATTSGDKKPAESAKTEEEAKPAKKKKTKAERKAAKQFKNYCISCHGTSGKGDGPGAAAFKDVKPRDWTDVAWQDSVTDDRILGVIRDGGNEKNGLNPLMPANPLHGDDPEILKALVALVRGFRRK